MSLTAQPGALVVTVWSPNTSHVPCITVLSTGADRPGFSTLRAGTFCCSILRAFRNQQLVSSILTAGSKNLVARFEVASAR